MSLSTNIQNLAVAMGTEVKATRVLLNGNAADLSGLTTTQKTNLVAAINWLHSELNAVAGGAAGINDASTSTNTTWSSSKTNAEISAAVAALVDGAPGALDTIKELADALGGQSGAITAIETALANRVRYDAVQTLTGPQQTQARANIGAGTSSLALGTTAGTAKAGDWKPAAADISDATATGRSVLTAASAATARAAIGAGTSSLALGTTSSTAKAGDYQPTAANISDASPIGQTVLTAASAAAILTAIGAASAAAVGDTERNFVADFQAALV